jgi:hypothetical protein
VDLTNWFCWVTMAGALFGLLAAIQQLLLHGLQTFVRAVMVLFVIGVALVLIYPYIQVRPISNGPQVALAVGTATADSPVAPARLENAPAVATAGPAAARREAGLAEPASLNPAPLSLPIAILPKPAEAAPVTSATAEQMPPAPVTAELGPVESVTPEPAPRKPGPIDSAAKTAAPEKPGTLPPGRSEPKPVLPALLSAQQKLFAPSEVAYCPVCFSAYSAKGPKEGVKCPHCAAKVNLVSDEDYMVHRCGKCGKLYRTTHFPPPVGPLFFRYYCPACGEHRWYPN